MDIFLSSPMEGLLDARSTLIEKIESKCKNKVCLRCYEKDKHSFPNLGPTETYLSLVQNCEAFVILFDQYYGIPSAEAPNISPTHAELREAFKHKLTIIPVARTQTWHEFKIWRKNRDHEVNYDHVRDPRLFEMLDEVYPVCNVQVYQSFTGEEALTKIAEAIDAIIQGAVGTLDHVAFSSNAQEVTAPAPIKPTPEPVEPTVPKKTAPMEPVPLTPEEPAPKEPTPAKEEPLAPVLDLPKFSNGGTLTADHMNALFQATYDAATLSGLPIDPPKKWKSGDAFKPDDLNGLINNIARIYNHIEQTPPKWSFGVFTIGSKFEAAYMNELVDSVRALLKH